MRLQGVVFSATSIALATALTPHRSLSYGETWNQTAIILKTTGLEYIDHIMMHC